MDAEARPNAMVCHEPSSDHEPEGPPDSSGGASKSTEPRDRVDPSYHFLAHATSLVTTWRRENSTDEGQAPLLVEKAVDGWLWPHLVRWNVRTREAKCL